jgi:hypothetical protein
MGKPTMAPKYKGERISTYFFWVFCFYIGLGVLTLLCLGQFEVDEREGPGWNPFSKMPNGRLGISEFFVASVGCVFVLAVGFLLQWLVREARY